MSGIVSEHWEAILEVIPDPVVIADVSTGEIVNASGQVSDLFGYTAEELVGKPQSALHPSGEAERYRELFGQVTEENKMFTQFPDESPLHVERADGERVPVEIHTKGLELDDQHLVIGMFRDTSERHQYEKHLQEQRDNLTLLNEVMRHDIRNHLQLVVAYAELLEDRIGEDQREYLDIIQESATQVIELTTTARDLADVMLRSDSERRRKSLDRTLEDEVEDIRSAYPGTVLTVEQSTSGVDVLADDMLDVVFRNLLKNAIQHNDTDVPKVTVSVEADDGQATVRISDNGPGVPDAQKERIFGRGELGLDSNGSGIGLYLVRALVESYDGDVWVENNDPDGATFVVRIPTAE
jgi:PAS domain S-box-containing protein